MFIAFCSLISIELPKISNNWLTRKPKRFEYIEKINQANEGKMSQELAEVISKLSPEQKTELLHFAEFLAEKNASENKKEPRRKKRGGLGSWKGKIHLSDDFDEPLEDFKNYM